MNRILAIARRILPTIIIAAAFYTVSASAETPPTVTPLVDCISTDSNGLTTATFGYNSTYAAQQFYLVGARNYFAPTAPNQGQPNFFDPGEHHAVFTVDLYMEDIPTLIWYLDGNQVSVTANSPQCHGTITYQGRLTTGGAPSAGNYDLQFRLYNQPTGGTAIGALATAANTPVANGIFTVPLEFGANAFATPAKLYMEISVKPAGSTGSYTTLQPRQPLTDAPSAVFATRAASAANADSLGGNASNQFVLTYDNRLTDARQPSAGSGNYIQNSTTQQANSNFNISGKGTIGDALTINADSGTNVVITGQSVSGIGTWLRLINTSTGGTGWNLISTGNANRKGAGNLMFDNGSTQMILSPSALTVNSSIATNKVNVTGGVLARGGAPGGEGSNNNGYAFSGNNGDNDSGLFGEANGQVSLYTNAGERVRVTDAGATVTGNLTVSGTISGTTTNATNATNVSGGFVQLPLTGGAPPASECNTSSQYGRQKVDAANVRLYICTAAGWKYTTLQ